MANFSIMDWATEVLEKVDRTAANTKRDLTTFVEGSAPAEKIVPVVKSAPRPPVDGNAVKGMSLTSQRGTSLPVKASKHSTPGHPGSNDSKFSLSATYSFGLSDTMRRLRETCKAMASVENWQRPELHQAFDSTMAAVRAKEERLDRGWAERHRLKEQADARIRVQQQELAHLREEGRACDLAYQGERHTHSALVAQAQMRDATLRAEGAAYENALTQMQRQVAAKEAEWVQLEQRMEACAGEAQSRRQRLQELQRELQAEEQAVRERAGHGSRRGEGSRHSGVAEGDGAEQGGEAVVEGANQVMGEEGIRKDQSGGEGADAGSRLGREGAGVVSSSWGGGQGHGEGSRGRGVEESRGRGEVGPGEREPGEDGGMGWSPRGGDSSQRREQEAGVLLQELERLRRHEVQLDKSIDQVEAVLHTYTKGDGWPSAGERLAELDRRLRALKEQLLAKKSQAEALDSEKLRLQQQLHHILSSQGASGDHRLHSALKRSRVQAMGHAATATGGNQGRGEMQERMLEVAKKMDVLGLRAGHHLWNNMPLRAAVILYVLLLHLIVFIIIAVDAMRG